MLSILVAAYLFTARSGSELAIDESTASIEIDCCSRWHGDAGIRGVLRLGPAPSVELMPCGLQPSCHGGTLSLLQDLLLDALGPLDVVLFAKQNVAAYVRSFAEAAVASVADSCRAVRKELGAIGPMSSSGACACDQCFADSKLNQEDVFTERALVHGLAAGSLLNEMPQMATGNHVALADITEWLRLHEHDLEWSGSHKADRATCLREGELFGYECRTFTYGSTYFTSWLRVMRHPSITSVVETAMQATQGSRDGEAQRHEFVVLGSSIGWQTLWAAVTFGLRSVGYELMEHRVQVALLAADRLNDNDTRSLVQFRQRDALKSDLSKAAVVYLTDLIWEDYLCTSVGAHVKAQLQASPGVVGSVIIISNKYSSWRKFNFRHVGQLQVPVTWQNNQTFHFWAPGPWAKPAR